MTEEILFDTLRQSLWVAVVMATPVLGAGLITGVIVGLFQALTSIQEMTLTFIPKMLIMLIVFWMSMSFMSNSLVSLFQGTIIPLISVV